MSALRMTPTVTSTMTKPTQSAPVQRARHRVTRAERQSRKTAARKKITGSIPSSPRTSPPIAQATIAIPIQIRVGRSSARMIRNRQSVE